MTDNRKILFLDIEWRPTKAYVWQPWKENIHPEKIIEHGGLLCFAAKWQGNKEMFFAADWTEGGHQAMLDLAHKLISEADAVVTYNGDRYDIPKLMGEFALANMPPPPMPTSIDVIKTVKKLGLFMNRLAFVGPLFEVGAKTKHAGFEMWVDVDKGSILARKKMQRYNMQDVRLLERLYKKLRPYIRNHPQLRSGDECPACTSKKTQKRGPRVTRFFRIQRNQCQDCGHWFETTRTRIK